MAYTAVVDQLRDAVESGDVLELEEAIDRARRVSINQSPSFTALYLKAQDMFAQHMQACRRYLKSLRNACASLDEPAIFQALLSVQEAPDFVQLMMYSDIRNAEDLREDILTAQQEVLAVLDSRDWRAVDRFLKQSAAVLDDRAVLALVQRREDLIKNAKRADYGARSPSKESQYHSSHSVCNTTARGPLASPRPCSSMPYASRENPATYRNNARASQVPRVSPQYLADLLTAEQHRRKNIAEAEHANRVLIYTTVLLSGAVQPPETSASTSEDIFPTLEDLSFLPPLTEEERGVEGQPIWFHSSRPREAKGGQVDGACHGESDPLPRRTAPAPQSLNSSVATNATPTPATGFNRVRPAPSTESSQDGKMQEQTATQSRLRSLNLSPIPNIPTVPKADVSSVHTGGTSPIHRPPPAVAVSSLSVTGGDTSAASIAAQRVAARLRAVVRDEDIRRRDIEGTEEFDRSVFLMPMSARIDLKRRTQQQRSAALRLY